jgi:hypothetical protein
MSPDRLGVCQLFGPRRSDLSDRQPFLLTRIDVVETGHGHLSGIASLCLTQITSFFSRVF